MFLMYALDVERDKKPYQIDFTPELHRRLKTRAAAEECTMAEVILKALEAYLPAEPVEAVQTEEVAK